jgi:hypothetical protein
MREPLIESAVCALLALAALGLAIWALFTGQVSAQGVDGLFLIAVCLLIAAAFSFVPFQAIREGLLQDLFRAKKTEAPPIPEGEIAEDKELAQNSSKST